MIVSCPIKSWDYINDGKLYTIVANGHGKPFTFGRYLQKHTDGGHPAPAILLRLEDIQQELFDITRGHLIDVLRWHVPSTNLQLMFHCLNNPPDWNMSMTKKFVKETRVNNVQNLMQYIYYLEMWTCYFYYLGSCCEAHYLKREGTAYPTRIFSMPLNSSGVLEMIQPMWMTSSCCSTASRSPWGLHLLYMMSFMTPGDSGLEITISSCPNSPRVTW